MCSELANDCASSAHRFCSISRPIDSNNLGKGWYCYDITNVIGKSSRLLTRRLIEALETLKKSPIRSSEKEKIEIATADAFIHLYNVEMNSSFEVVEYADAPDIRCKDSSENTLNLEITLTEDRAGDIPAVFVDLTKDTIVIIW